MVHACSAIEQEVTNTAIVFAIHVRRILDKAVRTKFALDEPFRIWSPTNGLINVNQLRDALNRIIHATEFKVGFEKLPGAASKIKGGAIGVIDLSTRTDQREEALIDVFALASCFYYQVLRELNLPDRRFIDWCGTTLHWCSVLRGRSRQLRPRTAWRPNSLQMHSGEGDSDNVAIHRIRLPRLID